MSLIHCLAASMLALSGLAIITVPSSLISISAPVSAVIFWMVSPPLPMTSRILSGLIWMASTRGAYGLISLRGFGNSGQHVLQDVRPAIFALLQRLLQHCRPAGRGLSCPSAAR